MSLYSLRMMGLRLEVIFSGSAKFMILPLFGIGSTQAIIPWLLPV